MTLRLRFLLGLVWGAVKTALATLLRRKADADSGAAEQRATDTAANQTIVDKAKADDDEIRSLSSDELRARAERWVRRPSGTVGG